MLSLIIVIWLELFQFRIDVKFEHKLFCKEIFTYTYRTNNDMKQKLQQGFLSLSFFALLWGFFSIQVAHGQTFTSFGSASTSINSSLVINGTNLTGVTSVKFGETPAKFTINSSTQITAIVPKLANTGTVRITKPTGSVLSTSISVSRQSTSYVVSSVTANFNSINVGSSSTSTFTDLDGDGLLDMIVGKEDGTLSHYEQATANSNSFTFVTAAFNTIDVGLLSAPTFTDLDGDGLLDMIVGKNDGTLSLYEQATANSTSFTLVSPAFNTIDVGTNSKPTFTDLDGDGLLDMIVGKNDGNLSHYEQTTANSNTFTLVTLSFNGIDVGFYSDPTITDLDGDGKLDMIIAQFDGNPFHYEQITANSTTFSLVSAGFNSIYVNFAYNSTFTDIDGDGLLDMMIGRADGSLERYEQRQSPIISSLSANSVCQGGTISISGTALYDASSWTYVTINGISVGNMTQSPTDITFTVPANATSGNVVVTTDFGTSNAVPLTINATPTASISGNTSFCIGGNTVLTSNATAGSGTISSYQWKVGGVNVASGGASATYTATAAGSYTVTVTNSNGCSFTSSAYVVSVNPLPSPTITASGATTVCSGGSVSLSATEQKSTLQFNGSTQSANLATLAVTTNTMTMEAWVYANGSQSTYTGLIMTRKDASYASGLNFSTTNTLGYIWNGAYWGWTGGLQITPNTWFHVALVIEPTKATIYLNGVPTVNTGANASVTFTDITQLCTDMGGRFFNGQMKEVRIWNAARTQAQIQAGMYGIVPTSSANLLAFYKLDEGTGTSVNDASAHYAAGSLVGAPSWVTATSPFTNSSFLWSPGSATTNSISATTTGNYTVAVTNANGCATTAAATTVTVDPVVVLADNAQPNCLGNGLNFNGINNSVTATSTTLGNFGASAFTVELWVKTSSTNNQNLINKRASCNNTSMWNIKLQGGVPLLEMIENTSGTNFFALYANKAINDGTWHHIACTRSATGGIAKIYIDGVLSSTATGAIANISTTASLQIGTSVCNASNDGTNYFRGTLDEIRLWTVERSAVQMAASMNTALIGTETGLGAYYDCNQGTSEGVNTAITTLIDKTAAANTATLVSFTKTGTTSNFVSGAGALSVCIGGSTAAFTNSQAGGTWAIVNGTGSATVSTAGVVTGVSAGIVKLTYSYSNACGNLVTSNSVTVSPNNTASAASTTPTLCINTPLSTITHSTVGATGIGTATGFPAGVTATWAANTITISGTPTASGTFNYSIPLTGGCGSVNATGTITVTANKTASVASSIPTLCISTALTNITHTTTGATGIGTATGLPAGVTATWANNTITVSGTPTASGTFSYAIPLTGGCGNLNATGTITVTPAMTASAASSTPSLCINTALTNITHSINGATGIVPPSAVSYSLPPAVTNPTTIEDLGNVTISLNGSVILNNTTPINSLSGTIGTASGTAGGYADFTAFGPYAMYPGSTYTFSLSSIMAAYSYRYFNAMAMYIDYNRNGVFTDAGEQVYTASALTLGDHTETGTFTIPSSALLGVTRMRVICNEGLIISPTQNVSYGEYEEYSISMGGIGSSGYGLPAGVTASWASNTLTISGTPTAAGTFNYAIPLTGGCGNVNATGIITVTPAMTASAASSTPTLCINTPLANITHSTTGATGIVSPAASYSLPPAVTIPTLYEDLGKVTIMVNGSYTTIINNITPINSLSGTIGTASGINGSYSDFTAFGPYAMNPGSTYSFSLSSITTGTSQDNAMAIYIDYNRNGVFTDAGEQVYAASALTLGAHTETGTFTIPTSALLGVTRMRVICNQGLITSPTQTINFGEYEEYSISMGGIGGYGLPAGVTAAWASNTLTISGTPTVLGAFNYAIPLAGGCGLVNATGTITVPTNTAGAASSTPTLCINTPLSNITHTTTAATGIGTATGLPGGVTAAWASNTITISGTPTASGTFNYSIPLTGGCGSANATGTITVTPALTASAASSTPSLCIHTALTNITHVASGIVSPNAANYSLPPAVTYPLSYEDLTHVTIEYNGNLVLSNITPVNSLSGTMGTASGTAGSYSDFTAFGPYNMYPGSTYFFSLSSGNSSNLYNNTMAIYIDYNRNGVFTDPGEQAYTSTPYNFGNHTDFGTFMIPGSAKLGVTRMRIICRLDGIGNSPITSPTQEVHYGEYEEYSINIGGIGASGYGLPAGVTAAWASNTITISGTPTASGNFNYSIPLTDGCAVYATGTITVAPAMTASAASSTPTLCINTPLTNITHSTTGATGILSLNAASYTLPPAVVYPTADEDLGNVTISLNGSVVLNNTTPINSLSGTIGTASGTAGGYADFTAFGSYAMYPGSTYTFSLSSITTGTSYNNAMAIYIDYNRNGVFTDAGEQVYSASARTLGAHTETGTFTIPSSALLGVTRMRVICNEGLIISPTQNVSYGEYEEYSISMGYGLPAGVTAAWVNNTITISGTPTQSGTFSYTIPLTGCGTVGATGTITVNTNTASAASSTPSLCINAPLTNITHSTTGATGIGTIIGLPSGVTASWASNTITISGTPTQSGTFNYSIPLTGGCGSANATGTIMVNTNTASVASSAPTLCNNTPLNITHTTTGATGIGTAIGLPIGVTAAWFYNKITISGTPTQSGTFNYAIPSTGGCGPQGATGTIVVLVAPSVTIAANPGNSITTGTSVTFTATPTNGGATPAYQWKKNGNNVGTNSITYTDSAILNGDVITCALTNNSPCTVTSNSITMEESYPCPSSTTWTSQSTVQNNNTWNSVTYGNGLYVAVSGNGKVMTSPDAITWTPQTSALNNYWTSVTYGNNLFVAVSYQGNIMTSGNGILWILQSPPVNPPFPTQTYYGTWYSVTYGNGKFVAVDIYGRTMNSPDGINWTVRGYTGGGDWTSVTYGNGKFVAVGERNAATSTNGGNSWENSTNAPPYDYWISVCYGKGLFVAVAAFGGVMTSPDGNTWTSQTPSPGYNEWYSVTYGNNLFVAVAYTGGLMTSPDGINWTGRTPAVNNSWSSVTYGNGVFVAVSLDGTNNRVMTSFPALVTPSVIIAANPGDSITTGTSVTYTATPTNGGFTPAYQWKKNGINVGNNSITYTDATLANGDIITCVLTSNNPCASTANANSNGITMVVLSANANLNALSLSSGTLSPTFASAITSYTASVNNAVSSITVTPTRSDVNATIQVRINGATYATVSSGVASNALPLNVGNNSIDVRVTAQDGTTTKTYTTTVSRCTLSSFITNVSICPSQLPYNWNGSRSAAGTYTYTTTNSQGCDSMATLYLTIKSPTSSTDSITINASQLPYSWNGLTFNAAGTQTAHLTNAAGCDSAATLTLSVTASTVAFHLKAMLQGLYIGNGKMIAAPFSADGVSPMSIADTITVELRDTTQFNVIHSIKGLLDTAGNAIITFPGSVNGNRYYLVVGHRNSIAVWSANPVTISATTNYDFTNAITKAFGSNMAEDGGVFMLFSGDINQDGSIDFSDYPDLDISSSNGDLGYLPFDLNGDASVDFSDYPTLDINSSQGVLVVTP